MKKRYLFFDIDGTLLSGGYGATALPASAKLVLDKLRAAGHFLAIATGRSEAMASGVVHDLGSENMVSDGGYGLTLHGKLLGIRPISREGVIALVNECDALGYPWGLQIDNSDTRLVPDGRFEDFTHDNYIKTKVVPGLRPEDQEIIYKAYVACLYPDEKKLKTLEHLPWCRFHREYFFVEPAAKGDGIRQMMDMLDADVRDVIVFGDSLNDLSMFHDDWTKVAMGNAAPELKALADYVTTDVDKDGIYNACLALGLFDA